MISITFLPHRVPSPPAKACVGICSQSLPPEITFNVAILAVGGSIAIFARVMTGITAVLYITFTLATTIMIKLPRGCVDRFEVDLLLLVIATSFFIT